MVKEKSIGIPLLPVWAFVACSRFNFTFIFHCDSIRFYCCGLVHDDTTYFDVSEDVLISPSTKKKEIWVTAEGAYSPEHDAG
jgi:hypothetical protein